jgi:DsbC/DsbD-like thiol-disulfide interchange protein
MFMPRLSRRSTITFLAALAAGQVKAADAPYSIRIFAAGLADGAYHGGVHVLLQEGWKTYWRVPGEGGIPPAIEAKGDNLKSFRFDCPLPSRFRGEEGESIGYKHEVLFPFVAVPAAADQPVHLNVTAFLGVCQTVCIPAKGGADIAFSPADAPSPDAALLAQWQAHVPLVQAAGPVSTAEVMPDSPLAIRLGFSATVTDVFVEGSPLHYFGPPQWSPGRDAAILAVSGAKSVADLKGQDLRITVALGDTGVEQHITLA